MQDVNNLDRLIPISDGFRMIGVGKTTGYAMIRSGELVQPRRVGRRRSAFLESELVAWMRARPVISVLSTD